jgi:hypothetical protein
MHSMKLDYESKVIGHRPSRSLGAFTFCYFLFAILSVTVVNRFLIWKYNLTHPDGRIWIILFACSLVFYPLLLLFMFAKRDRRPWSKNIAICSGLAIGWLGALAMIAIWG